MEEVWKSDPFYLEPLPPLEPFGGPRKTLAEVLAERNEVSNDGASKPTTGRPRRPRRPAVGRGQPLGGDCAAAGAPAVDLPAMADPVPGVVEPRDAPGAGGAVA